VLCGLNAERKAESPPVIWAGDRFELGVGPCSTDGYDAALGREQGMAEAERIRVLYVAATRAEDHLVVSAHHRRGRQSDAALLSDAAAATSAPWIAWEPPPLRRDDDDAGNGHRVTTSGVPGGLEARATWAATRARRLRALRRAKVVAATAVAELVEPAAADSDTDPAALETATVERARPSRPLAPLDPPDTDDSGWVEAPDPPRRRGRAGTARGRAVHAVLQTVDLATGTGLAEAARAQAEAEGIPDLTEEIELVARAALAAAVVRGAVAAPRAWREMAVATPVDGMVLEGFIDLVYETAAGLVVVDYKTDHLPDDGAERERVVARYQHQIAAYAAALAALLDRPVARAVLLFAHRGGTEEVDVADLPAAVAAIRTALRSEAERLDRLRAAVVAAGEAPPV